MSGQRRDRSSPPTGPRSPALLLTAAFALLLSIYQFLAGARWVLAGNSPPRDACGGGAQI